MALRWLKKIFKIFAYLLIGLLLLNTILLFLINRPFVQKKILQETVSLLTEKTNAKIRVEGIQADLFDGVFLRNLYVEDQRHDTLAYVETLNVDYSLSSIYRKNTLCLRSVSLCNFVVKLVADNDTSDYNFRFLLDAFADEDNAEKENSPSEFKIRIDDILLRNGRFSHDILSEKDTNQFNYKHLSADIHDADLSIALLLPKSVEGRLKRFDVSEKSGLTIRNISADARFFVDSIIVAPSICVQTPNSTLTAKNVSYRLKEKNVGANIAESSIVAADFQCFFPELSSFPDPIRFSADIDAPLPRVSAANLRIDCPGNFLFCTDDLEMGNYEDWQSSNLIVRNASAKIEKDIVKTLEERLNASLPSEFVELLPASVALTATGNLPNLQQSIDISSPLGEVSEYGLFSYSHEKNKIAANTKWNVDLQNLEALLKTNIVGSVSAKLNTKLYWCLNQKPNVSVEGNVDNLTLNQYTYSAIAMSADYSENNDLKLKISLNDPNCMGDVDAQMENLLSDEMKTMACARIRHIDTHQMSLTDSTERITGSVNLRIDGVGMDYNLWQGSIALDSLNLMRNDKHIAAAHIDVSQKKKSDGKILVMHTPFASASMSGVYNLDDIYTQVQNVLHSYLPSFFPEQDALGTTVASFSIETAEIDTLLHFIGMDAEVMGPIRLDGEINTQENDIRMALNTDGVRYNNVFIAPTSFTLVKVDDALNGFLHTIVRPNKEDDFSALAICRMTIRNDSIYNTLKVGTSPDTLFVRGDLNNCISFYPLGSNEYRIKFDLNPSEIKVNQQDLMLNNAVIELLPAEIDIKNLGISNAEQQLFSVNGKVSSKLSDTLNIRFNHLKLKTITTLLFKIDEDVDCDINGNLKACAVLGEGFRFFTKDMRADSIMYGRLKIGDLSVRAIWDNAKKGVFAKMNLSDAGKNLMDVKGMVAPAEKRMRLNAVLDSLPLELVMPFANDYLSDLSGRIGANLSIEGMMSSPEINGYVSFKDARAKVDATGVTYSVSDSIKLNGNRFSAKRFKVKDDFGNSLVFNGDVKHEKFKNFDYSLSLDMRNFALLNNPADKNRMLYGSFFVNGKNIQLKGTEKGASITGEISNAENTIVNIVLPESVTEASSYDNIVYVKSVEQTAQDTANIADDVSASDFDLYANIKIGLTDKAAFYVNIADGAMVKGNGDLQFVYEDNTVSLYNRFTVDEGFLKIKLSGLPSKKFNFRQGSYVDFMGDPMKLRFNATATYSLTADLNTLNSSFSTMYSSSTRVPVNCNLTASGDLSDMKLNYDVELPKADDDVKQTVASIINTDNIRIKEFAYLIGLGMFNDPSGQVESNALMSFASSSLSSTINSVLGGFLGDKVTIGTDINTSQEDFSDVEASVSVSTKLANDRLLLSTNLGVQKRTEATSDATFLGDFDAEYLLGKRGMFRVKAYNHTNNEIYRTSNNTQGIGFSFVRESKKLNQLFKLKSEFVGFGKDGMKMRSPCDSIPFRRKEEKDE